jgi:glycosyltransferase involved in cell wall biosynthesis
LVQRLNEVRNRMLSGDAPTGDAPVRLAFCITELDAGGAERGLMQLVLGLDRSQWQSRVFCLGPPGPFASVLLDEGIPVRCFYAVHLWDAPRIVWEISHELRSWQPALLQTFLFHANILGRMAGRCARVPRIVCGQRVAERRASWYGRIDRWTDSCVDRHVCVSQGVAAYCEQFVGLPREKLVVIPNGVELARFDTATPCDWTVFGVPADGQVLIAIGRLEPQKGIDVLLNAFATVAEQHAHSHLVIVGDGPDRAALQQQAEGLQLKQRVTFVGRRDDVPRLLAGSVALVLPSRWEGMPNVVLEAMAAAKPVIATQVEGTQELVRPGRTGWLVPVDDATALSQAMCELLGDAAAAIQLGRESQRIVSSEFTISAMVTAYDRLYRELVAASR